MPNSQPITISILATPDSSPSTLYGLLDVLGTVGVGWESYVTGKPVEPKFDVRIVAATKQPFRCAGNALVTPHCSVEEVQDTDIALVGSLVIPNTPPIVILDKRELDWLVRLQSRGSTIASVCSGSIMLAESGLLDGWEATSHWVYRDLFQLYYPGVRWRIEQKLCVSGQDDQIVTSGGATSWLEMALYLITRFCGVDYAAHTAKFWVIPGQEETQAPYAVMTRSILHDDGVVNECQAWIAEHYENPNPIAAMVERSGLPPTTFARRFKRATGYRPMDYVHALRVEEAKEMLEIGGDAIDRIGREVGYEDPASFRRIFKRKVGLTPSIYRRRFYRSRFERYDGMRQSFGKSL